MIAYYYYYYYVFFGAFRYDLNTPKAAIANLRFEMDWKRAFSNSNDTDSKLVSQVLNTLLCLLAGD